MNSCNRASTVGTRIKKIVRYNCTWNIDEDDVKVNGGIYLLLWLQRE